jgi:catechol 2,3-dioxygenase-like lactoylglutathione lyase family enzyme
MTTIPFMPMPIIWVPVLNVDRARKFYVDKVGLELRQDITGPRARRVLVAPEGSRTALALVESASSGSLGLVLYTDDLMADYDRLLTKGVEFERPPKDEPWGVDAVFRDPDGNRLILRQQNASL